MKRQQVRKQPTRTETEEEYAEWLAEVWNESVREHSEEISRDALNVADRITKEVG